MKVPIIHLPSLAPASGLLRSACRMTKFSTLGGLSLLFMGASPAQAGGSLVNSLTGFTGHSQSNFPSQPAALSGSGLNVSFVWGGGAGAWERISFSPSGATFGSNTPGSTGSHKGRNYLRTHEMNFSGSSFRAFVTVSRPSRVAVFFGIGNAALGDWKQPDVGTGNASAFLELQEGYDNASRRLVGGTSATPTNVQVGYDGMANVTGLMRLRMDYNAIAKTVVYAIDYSPSGAFVADQVFPLVNVSSIAPEWEGGENSRIFFGGQGNVVFTDFVVDTAGFPFAGDSGRLTREVWENVPGMALSSFTGSPRYFQAPDAVTTVVGAAVPQDIGNKFASRIRGYITAPVTGAYTFWIASDDESELRLSSSASKLGRARVASVVNWVDPFDWDVMPSQKSSLISLVAGQKYFIEALHKDAFGGDHLAIAWQIPGGSRELIPASALESFTADALDLDNDDLPDSWEIAHGFSATAAAATPPNQVPTADPDHDGYTNLEEAQLDMNPNVRSGLPGSLLLETWKDLPGAAVSDLTWNTRFCVPADLSEFIFTAETPQNRDDYFGIRLRGSLIAPITGSYTFYLSGDDSCQLWLSTSGSQFAKQKIAFVNGFTALRHWTHSATQQSIAISLTAGQKYYLEALGKETWGQDHLSIGWVKPGSSSIDVIPGNALESYCYDTDDADGDNIPAAWEAANGLDPALNDAAADPDSDGITNLTEYDTATNPQVKNTFQGALLEELWWNVPGDRTALLDTEPRLLQPPDEHFLALFAKGTKDRPEHYANRLRGYLTAPVSGTYTFWAAGDDEVDFFLSTTSSKFDKQLLVHPSIIGLNLDADVSMKSRAITLVAGQRYFMEIRHIDSHGADYCEVAWQIPGGTREIIPGSFLSTFIPTTEDRDDDDIPDAYELANGLSITDNGRINPVNGARGDLDGDGLVNLAEWKAGTRADLVDTDGDGVNDEDEVAMGETSALSADIAPFEPVITLPGDSYTANSGSWLKQNGKAKQDCVRGWLEYPVTLTTAGVYQLHLTFTPVADAGVSPNYEIVFSADGKTIQRAVVNVLMGTQGHAKILSPWLAAGSHTLRVFIDNSYHLRRVTVDQLEILAARGPDTNSNDTPDWIDLRLAKYNSLEAPVGSLTSPVCLEGKAKWSDLSTINGATVQTAPNDRWYADVPLDATQPTEVTASLENAGLTATRQIDWLPTNLLTTGFLSIRLGDSLKLSAFIGITGTSGETVNITVEGQTTTMTADQPLVHTFSTPGSIPIQVTHSLGGNLTTATAIINVVAAPVIESPVCVVGALRELEIPALPGSVTLQLDSGLVIRDTVTLPDGGNCYILNLPTLGDLPAVTRIGTTGPILGSIPFRMMRLRTTAQTGVFVGGQIDPSTVDIHMPVIVDGLYAGTKIDFRIFIGGVTFDDGTIRKSLIMPGSVNADGECLIHFYKTGSSGSNCHRIDIFQGVQKIACY
jgi:PA14 domain